MSGNRHLFICTNVRPIGDTKPSCQGSLLHERACAILAREEDQSRHVLANKAGCLGRCSEGPVMIVQPDTVRYGSVRLIDVDDIVRQHVLGGSPVERLRIP